MKRECKKCGGQFEPVDSIEARLQAKGRSQTVCPRCVLKAIDDYGKDPGYIKHIERELEKAESDRAKLLAFVREVARIADGDAKNAAKNGYDGISAARRSDAYAARALIAEIEGKGQ